MSDESEGNIGDAANAAADSTQPAEQNTATVGGNRLVMRWAKWLAALATIIVGVALVAMTMFALQLPPFAAKGTETCELVDEVSDQLGESRSGIFDILGKLKKLVSKPDSAQELKDTTETISKFNSYLANKDIAKAILICDIEREIVWYGRVGLANQILASVGAVLVIVLTLATSFILGAGWTASAPGLKAVTVALPLISTALTALMSEFHLSDGWQLREIGRIEAKALLGRAFDLDLTAQDFDEKLRTIRTDLLKLERDQAERFFTYRFRTREQEVAKTPPKGAPVDGTKQALSQTDASNNCQKTCQRAVCVVERDICP